MKRLADKVAVISGAGQGIGRAAAERFATEGATVVIAEIDATSGTDAEKNIRAAGGRVAFVQVDVSSSDDVQALFATVKERFGALHVLYNNASVFLPNQDASTVDLDEAVWEKVIAINLRGLYLCCKYGIALMIESGGGSVINTSSSAGVMGVPGCDAYTASKGATIALTRSMAVAYGHQGVRVNCIAPAGIETEMVRRSSLDKPDFDAEYFFKRAPLGRLGSPEEVANLALFLASDESTYLTGAIIRADGGTTVAPISG